MHVCIYHLLKVSMYNTLYFCMYVEDTQCMPLGSLISSTFNDPCDKLDSLNPKWNVIEPLGEFSVCGLKESNVCIL